MNPLSDVIPTKKYAKDLLKIKIVMQTGTYEVREQYFIYDGNTFIADIGGYLGLLLGHSILSIVQFLAQRSGGGCCESKKETTESTDKVEDIRY